MSSSPFRWTGQAGLGLLGLLLCHIGAALPADLGRHDGRDLPGHRPHRAAWAKVPLHFETASRSPQASSTFLTRGAGYAASVSAGGIEFHFAPTRAPRHATARSGPAAGEEMSSSARLELVGAHPHATGHAEEPLPGRVHYFIGSDPTRWRTDVATYARVRFAEVYPGVDLLYYGNQRQLEYDFRLRPGADPEQLAFRYSAIEEPRIDTHGDLLLATPAGELRQVRPVAYTESPAGRTPVQADYRIAANGTVQFALGDYDRSRTLVIDPIVTFASYLGGSSGEEVDAVGLDDEGAIYLGGTTRSPDFPLAGHTAGANSAFVTKLDPTGTTLLYTAIMGGGGSEANLYDLDVSADGRVTMIGRTGGFGFPLVNPLQPQFGGGTYDAFVGRLGVTGGSLEFMTYLGGNDVDEGKALAVDSGGYIHVTGTTASLNFPVVNPVFEPAAVSLDGFAARLNPTASAFVYSTYLIGGSQERPGGIDADAAGNTYVAGATASQDFPLLNSLYPPDGFDAAWVVSINATGGSLRYSTLLGGSYIESATDIAVDAAGNAFVSGSAYSTDYPVVNGSPHTPTINWDYFITQLNPAGSQILFSTCLGGSQHDFAGEIALDPDGNVTLVGTTESTNFPVSNAVQGTHGGGTEDGTVVKVNPATGSVVYSTFFGGGGRDGAITVAADAYGNAYAAGHTQSLNFPDVNAFTPTYRGGAADGWVAKLGVMPPPTAPANLGATPVSTVQIDLAWTEASSTETEIQLFRKTGGAGSAAPYVHVANLAPNSVSHTDTGLSPGTEYTYRVRAFNPGGPSAYAGPVTTSTLPLPPAAPSSLTVMVLAGDQLSLQWQDNSNNEAAFEVERRTPKGSFTQIATPGPDTTTYIDTGLTVDTQYVYRVRATNAGGPSGYTSEAGGRTLAVPPAAPSELGVTVLPQAELRLDWKDNSTTEAAFEVVRRTRGGPASQVASLGPNTTRYTDSELAPNADYFYRVRATNSAGASAFTGEASARTTLLAPAAPGSLAVTAPAQNQLRLTWQDNSNNEAGFQIERRLAGSKYALIATLGANKTTYTDTGLLPAMEFVYRLRAVNSGGASEYTSEATGQTWAPTPTPPGNLTVAAVSTTELRLHWMDTSNSETGFRIERKAGRAFILVAEVAADVTTVLVGALPANTSQTFRVRAFNLTTESGFSTTAVGLTLPLGPTQLQAGPGTAGGQVKLTWKDSNPVPAGFVVERRQGKGAFAQVGTVAPRARSWIDTQAPALETVTYRMRAKNASGFSADSAEVMAAVPGGTLAAPASVNFGRVPRKQTREVTITLRNSHRTQPLRVSVQEPAAPFSLVSKQRSAVIPAQGSLQLVVRWSPAAAGRVIGILSVESSDPRNPLKNIKLVGTAR